MMYIMYRLDYHVLRKIAPAFFALSLLLILALIPFGKTANGATRWIRFGPIGVQLRMCQRRRDYYAVCGSMCGRVKD